METTTEKTSIYKELHNIKGYVFFATSLKVNINQLFHEVIDRFQNVSPDFILDSVDIKKYSHIDSLSDKDCEEIAYKIDSFIKDLPEKDLLKYLK